MSASNPADSPHQPLRYGVNLYLNATAHGPGQSSPAAGLPAGRRPPLLTRVLTALVRRR